MNVSDFLTAVGVPGQTVAYVLAVISIATVLFRVLPAPSTNGWYKTVYDVISRLANLTIQPSDIHTIPTSLPPKV